MHEGAEYRGGHRQDSGGVEEDCVPVFRHHEGSGLLLGRLASSRRWVLATLPSGQPVPSVSYVDWLDLPIVVCGDPFVPVRPCRVLSKSNAWLFEPHSVGGGIWCRVPGHWTTPEGLAVSYPVAWHEYAWIIGRRTVRTIDSASGSASFPAFPLGSSRQ